MKLTKRKLAIISGFSLIIMALAAGISYGYIQTTLVDSNSISKTINNLTNNLNLFRIGLLGWLVVIITDLIVTISMYYILKPFNKTLSLINSGLRFIYTIFLTTAVFQLFRIHDLLSHSPVEEVIIKMTSTNLFDNFENIWSIGLIIFGLHLFLMGWIAFKFKVSNIIISALLMIAGFSYIIVHSFTFSWISTLENILIIPMAIGELAFAVWLITRGGK